MKIQDWNQAHKIKEQIEKEYFVVIHILGDATFVDLKDIELRKLNNYEDCIMLETEKDYINLTALEWFEKVINIFIDKNFPKLLIHN